MKKKIHIFFLGIVFLFIILEVSFRLIHFIKPLRVENLPSPTSDAKILCLGNSFTLGTGAAPGESYPDFLQKIVSNNSSKKIQVINSGIGVLNSAVLIRMLPELLKQHSPSFVLLQIGQANTFNITNYQDYWEREFNATRPESLLIFLYAHLHTVRFMHYIWSAHHTQEELFQLTHSLHPETNDNRFINEYGNPEAYREWSETKILEEVPKIEAKIKEKQANFQYYTLLGDIYRSKLNNEKKAMEVYIAGIYWDPHFWQNSNYERLLRLEAKTKNQAIKEQINDFKNKFSSEQFGNAQRLFSLKDSEISDWLTSDLKEIHNILKQAKIPFIVFNYPPLITDYYSPQAGTVLVSKYYINEAIRNFALTNKIPFYDLENSLWKYWEEGNKEKLYSYYSKLFDHYDYHLNGTGYKRTAEELYQVLLQSSEFQTIIKN